ncbi:MAG: hypothetical protein ACON47_00645 [Flavobacteriaceae bacterium]
MEIYSLKEAEPIISNCQLIESTKGKWKDALIDKHNYFINLILFRIIRGDNEDDTSFYVNLNSKELKPILGREYRSIIDNLKDLKLIEENRSYQAGSFSKSYRVVQTILNEGNYFKYTLKSEKFKAKIRKSLLNQTKQNENNTAVRKVLENTLKLMLLDEPIRFTPERDMLKVGKFKLNHPDAPTVVFVTYKDNPHRLFRYEEFRVALLNLNEYTDILRLIEEQVYYRPSVAKSGRIYHMATSIPRLIRKGLRTKDNEIIYEVDMASAQPSILMLEWLKSTLKNNVTDKVKSEIQLCKQLILGGGIYYHIKMNSKFYGGLTYEKLKKAVISALNKKNTNEKPINELRKIFPAFIRWIDSIKKEKGYKLVSHLEQSKEAELFVGVYEALPEDIFTLIIHDCILTNKDSVKQVKEALIKRTKQMYSGIISKSDDLDNLFKVDQVSFTNDQLNDHNYFTYVESDEKMKQIYYDSLVDYA